MNDFDRERADACVRYVRLRELIDSERQRWELASPRSDAEIKARASADAVTLDKALRECTAWIDVLRAYYLGEP